MIARNLLFEVLSLATKDAVRDGVAGNCPGDSNPIRPDLLDRRHVHRGVTAVVGAVGGAAATRTTSPTKCISGVAPETVRTQGPVTL
jgi:hypothetical protein